MGRGRGKWVLILGEFRWGLDFDCLLWNFVFFFYLDGWILDFDWFDFGFRWGLGWIQIGWFGLAWWWCGGGVVVTVVGGVWSSWVTVVALFGYRWS